jgi:hypothetical protein
MGEVSGLPCLRMPEARRAAGAYTPSSKGGGWYAIPPLPLGLLEALALVPKPLAIFNPIRSKAFGFRVCLYRANRHLKETPMAVVEGSPSPHG